jgi:methionine aminopeptidase
LFLWGKVQEIYLSNYRMTAAEIVSTVLCLLKDHTHIGISTLTLNNIAEAEIKRQGGFSMLQGYKPVWAKERFPTAIAIQLNHQIAYGIPLETVTLQSGDIVSYDVVVKKDFICAEGSITLGVGELSERDRMLIRQTRKALRAGLNKLKAGVPIRQIAEAIDRTAGFKGFVVSHTFTGHGIGTEIDQPPYIYQCRNWLCYRQKRWPEGKRGYYDDEWGNLWVRMTEGPVKGEIFKPAIQDWRQLDDLRLPNYFHPRPLPKWAGSLPEI